MARIWEHFFQVHQTVPLTSV